MISYKKILVPVDFSEASKKAVTYGMTLAAQCNARLVIAHIVADTSALHYAFPTETFDVEKQQYEKARHEIQRLVPAKCAAHFDVQTIVKTGSIDAELLAIVNEEAAGLVVMGTHGRRHLGRWFLGSVTERMLRKCPVPMLTVGHLGEESHAIELGFVAIKHILYATDLSDSSPVGMQHAVELARSASARLTVAHVVDYARFILLSGTASGYLEEGRRKWVHSMEGKLNEFVEREKPAGLEVERVVLQGEPYKEILQFGETFNVDIIVLNLHSKGLLERAFIGSTAERVVRLAQIPVLSVPIVST
jgi:nucleotide-binding universal stress UspA family protein